MNQGFLTSLRTCILKHSAGLLLPVILMLAVQGLHRGAYAGDHDIQQYAVLGPDDYQEGVIRVKFTREAVELIENSRVQRDASGIVTLGLEELDQIHRNLLVDDLRPSFSMLNERDGGAMNHYRERHRAFGLHQWYDFYHKGSSDLMDVLGAYAALDMVEQVQPVLAYTLFSGPEDPPEEYFPNDSLFHKQWYLHNQGQTGGLPGADINVLGAWQKQRGSPEVIVAIMDTGIKFQHPDLGGNMWSGRGYNFYRNRVIWTVVDPHCHGTAVAGLVAAESNNVEGVAGVAGGSGNGDGVRLMDAKIFNTPPHNQKNAHLALVWAADHGAAIANNSWGSVHPDVYDPAVLQAIDYFTEYGGGDVMGGGLVVFSAGNNIYGATDGCYYPACHGNAMAVAASLHNDSLAWAYTVYGDHIDITAPGGQWTWGTMSDPDYFPQRILTAIALSSTIYDKHSGTSYAAPLVSGAAALIVSEHPGVFTAQQVRNILKQGAESENFYSINADYVGKLGSGRLDVSASMEIADAMVESNPVNVKASPLSTAKIRITWEQNTRGQNVMLAAVPRENAYVKPSNGTAYPVGAVIGADPRAIVLYRGPGKEFDHKGLDVSTNYYYRLWSYDEDNIYSTGITLRTVTVPPPQNLSAEHLENGRSGGVELNWTEPGSYIYWDKSAQPDFAFGRPDGQPVTVAQRFSQLDLQNLNAVGKELTHLSIVPLVANLEYMLKLWVEEDDDGPLGEPLRTISYTAMIQDLGKWQKLELDETLIIPHDQAMWVGYRVGDSGGNPIAADEGPAVAGRGDLFLHDFGDGPAWHTLYPKLGVNRNFTIRAYFASDGEEDRLAAGVQTETRGEDEEDDDDEFFQFHYSPILQYYEVYRNNDHIATVDHSITSWTDEQPPAGVSVYTVKAVYSNPNVTSGPSNEAVANTHGF